ncbi:polyadenylate-binding protein 2 [Scheffersomyces coipomensis]|uniref:polyadenylate-binding protein 2 n=1 Tax=Scheffersomyces coipomensis TaxID=1788519 RepID=UPI00315DB4FE
MSDQIPVDNQDVIFDSAESITGTSETTNTDVGLIESSRLEEMEKEAQRLRDLHSQLNSDSTDGAPQTDEEKRDIDSRSIYIGNVDYGSTPLELQQHFSNAGIVNRVTILMNKFTGQPKGFAYLEFSDMDGVNKAVATLDGSTFRDRELKVSAKRTNIPGLSTTNRGGSFRGGARGGRGGRGAFRGARGGRGGRGGRGAFRGNRFTPY